MRTKFLTLVALLVAGAVRADVVIENTAAPFLSNSSSAGFTISFTNNGTSATLSTFKLFNSIDFSEAATFTLTRVTGNTTYSETLTSTAGHLFTFGGSIASAALTNSDYTLAITGIDASYDYTAATHTLAVEPAFGAYGFSGTPTSTGVSDQFFRYQLSAVPEPGTMLLGGIAAAVGGAGAWWKRRKQRLAAAEAAATPA